MHNAAKRQGQINRYLLWRAVFPTDSFAVSQENRKNAQLDPASPWKTHFLISAVKTPVFLCENQKQPKFEFTLSLAVCTVCKLSSWYYFIMTETICYSYQGLSAFSPWITESVRGLGFCFHTLMPSFNLTDSHSRRSHWHNGVVSLRWTVFSVWFINISSSTVKIKQVLRYTRVKKVCWNNRFSYIAAG